MAQYTFTISDGHLFSDTEELPDDDVAWQQALQTVRDIETMRAGGSWSLLVAREGDPLYRIEVRTQRF